MKYSVKSNSDISTSLDAESPLLALCAFIEEYIPVESGVIYAKFSRYMAAARMRGYVIVVREL